MLIYTGVWNGKKGSGLLRVGGGFGIYEAPAPWGPWRTVYFTEQWDVGPGERAAPPKWMSADGRTLYFAFSGDDNFCIHKATGSICRWGHPRAASPHYLTFSGDDNLCIRKATLEVAETRE